MVKGAPDVLYVYALDKRERKIRNFADKYVYFTFISINGCNLEITFAPKKNKTKNKMSQNSDSDFEIAE